MDEADIKVKGHWKYDYQRVDKQGNVMDFLLCINAMKRRFVPFSIRQSSTMDSQKGGD